MQMQNKHLIWKDKFADICYCVSVHKLTQLNLLHKTWYEDTCLQRQIPQLTL